MNQTPENIHEYFKYVTDKDQAWTAIGLTEKAGEFQGVVYRYGTIVPPKEPTSKADLYKQKDDDKMPFKFGFKHTRTLFLQFEMDDTIKLLSKIMVLFRIDDVYISLR